MYLLIEEWRGLQHVVPEPSGVGQRILPADSVLCPEAVRGAVEMEVDTVGARFAELLPDRKMRAGEAARREAVGR